MKKYQIHGCRFILMLLLFASSVFSAENGLRQTRHPSDPYEPFNRSVYAFNEKLDVLFVRPPTVVYKHYVPRPIQRTVGRFFTNLSDVKNTAYYLLQAKPEQSLHHLMRFIVNSTFGLAGLLDVATPMGLKQTSTQFGDILRVWGWEHSVYLVLPVFGPSTVRDGLGRPFDVAAGMAIGRSVF